MAQANKEIGIKAENYFASCLNAAGVPYEFIDDWFDFEVCGQKVEVKSCCIAVKQNDGYRAGRFDFTDEENRDLQYKHNVWVCFIARGAGQYIMLGFCKARQLKKARYITLNKYKRYKLLCLEDWLKKVNK